MLVSLHQSGAGLTAMYDKHECYLYQDIRESNVDAKKKGLALCLLKISDSHREQLFRGHP